MPGPVFGMGIIPGKEPPLPSAPEIKERAVA